MNFRWFIGSFLLLLFWYAQAPDETYVWKGPEIKYDFKLTALYAKTIEVVVISVAFCVFDRRRKFTAASSWICDIQYLSIFRAELYGHGLEPQRKGTWKNMRFLI